jgi:hypothetical protein
LHCDGEWVADRGVILAAAPLFEAIERTPNLIGGSCWRRANMAQLTPCRICHRPVSLADGDGISQRGRGGRDVENRRRR